jgi:hypothetical protein
MVIRYLQKREWGPLINEPTGCQAYLQLLKMHILQVKILPQELSIYLDINIRFRRGRIQRRLGS